MPGETTGDFVTLKARVKRHCVAMRTIAYLVSALSVTLLVVIGARFGAALRTTAVEPVAPAVRASIPKPAPVRPDRFYRWRDANGHIHYRTTPPPASVMAEEVPFVRRKPAPEPVPPTRAVPATTPHRDIGLDSLLSIYTPEGMAELMNEVERTAKRLDKREQRLDELQDLIKRR